MPLFAYVARDARGARVEGRLEAASAALLADALAAQGVLLVRADPCLQNADGAAHSSTASSAPASSSTIC